MRHGTVSSVMLAGICFLGGSAVAGGGAAGDERFTRTFPACASLSSTGSNRFMVLEPGWQLVLAGNDEGERVELTITVLGETLVVDGVETRVVEERETKDGELFEVSRNYFAFCNDHGSIFYYGEDVDFYEGGQIVSHDGSWRSGVNGARFGLQMPGLALLGARYFQEVAPGVALDKGEIVRLHVTKETPAGTFQDCLKVRETNALDPTSVEAKLYAPGIGLIKDGPLQLVEFGFAN